METMQWQARPTTYKGIKMRSRLEAQWAEYFDKKGWPWEYEPRCFADETGQYLPDFRYQCPDEWYPTYMELKGYMPDAMPVIAKMEIILASEPTAELVLLCMNPDVLYIGGSPAQSKNACIWKRWSAGAGEEMMGYRRGDSWAG